MSTAPTYRTAYDPGVVPKTGKPCRNAHQTLVDDETLVHRIQTRLMRVGRARQVLGLSQQGLADLLGVNRVTVATWEVGTKRPNSTALFALSVMVELKRRGELDDVLSEMDRVSA